MNPSTRRSASPSNDLSANRSAILSTKSSVILSEIPVANLLALLALYGLNAEWSLVACSQPNYAPLCNNCAKHRESARNCCLENNETL
jgi:hypothetical protein